MKFTVSCPVCSCGSVLIQQGADLLSPVVQVSERDRKEDEKKEELPAEWKWKPLTKVKVKVAQDKKEIPLFQVSF